MKDKTVRIWIIVTVLVLIITISVNSNTAVTCWDGVEVSEPLLMDLCGITPEEYFSPDFDYADCPDADLAANVVSECEPDWPAVWQLTAVVMGLYLLLSALFFIVRRLVKIYR